MQHYRTVLPNGLRIVCVPMASTHSVTVAISVGLGSRWETASEAGASHLVEHMLFKGTEQRRTAADIASTLDSVGGILNGSTDKEMTVYWAKVARNHLGLAVEVLADMLRHSRVTSSDVAKEKRVVLEELSMLLDDPQDWVHVLADELMWPHQPAGREVVGTRESVEAIQRRHLRRYLDQYYGSNNVVVSVAGGVEVNDVVPILVEYFGDWKRVPPPAAPPPALSNGAPRLRLEHKPTGQVNLCLIYSTVGHDHPDRWALDMLCTILGGGTSSRLFVQVRERLGLAYDIHAYSTYLADAGSLVVYAGADKARAQMVLDSVFKEIARLQKRAVSSDELDRAKQYFRGRLWLGLEDTYAVASWFAATELLGHQLTTPEQVADVIDAVTTRDLLRVARRYLAPESAKLAAVGPVSSLDLENHFGTGRERSA